MSDGVKRAAFLCIGIALCIFAVAFSSSKSQPVSSDDACKFNIIETFTNGNITFMGEDGTQGYADAKGDVILKAKWDTIKPITGGRFIVTKAGNPCKGIINSSEKIISPFIYKSFEKFSDKLLVGYASEGGKLFLLNASGNRYANEEWDTIDYTDDTNFTLTQGTAVYSCKLCDNKLIITNISSSKTVLGKEIKINYVPNDALSQIPFNNYEKITDTSIEYVLALFSGDKESLKNSCTDSFYKKAENIDEFLNYKFVELTYINPQIEKAEDGTILYHSTVRVCYDTGEGTADFPNEVCIQMFVYFDLDDYGCMRVSHIE